MPESNSQRTYPIVLMPDALIQAQTSLPNLPTFNQNPPPHPGPVPQQITATVVMVQTTASVLPGVALATQQKTRIAGIGLVIAALLTISISTWRRRTQHQKRQITYNRRVESYNQQLAIYREAERRYAEQLKTVRSPENIEAFQMKLMLEVLICTASPDGRKSRAPRGWSEPTFAIHLKHYFPKKIFIGRSLRNEERGFSYTPDFIYWDPKTRLHVDIELDEPYAYRKRIPTHYIGCKDDEDRDRFFLNKGWLIVRFSEEQVIRCPESCCKAVAQAIATIDGKEVLLPFSDVPDLLPMPCWTKEEASVMLKESYRDSYLKE